MFVQHSPGYDLPCGLTTVRLYFLTLVKNLITVLKPLVDTYCHGHQGHNGKIVPVFFLLSQVKTILSHSKHTLLVFINSRVL